MGPFLSDVQAPFYPWTLNLGLQEDFSFLWLFNSQLIRTIITDNSKMIPTPRICILIGNSFRWKQKVWRRWRRDCGRESSFLISRVLYMLDSRCQTTKCSRNCKVCAVEGNSYPYETERKKKKEELGLWWASLTKFYSFIKLMLSF